MTGRGWPARSLGSVARSPGQPGDQTNGCCPRFLGGGTESGLQTSSGGRRARRTPPGTPRAWRQKATLTVQVARVYTAPCCGAKWGLVVEPRVVW